MAMGLVKGQAATLQVEMVCLDELVSEDDRYRKLDRLVEWSFVREVARSYYARDVGRPSIDPIVLVKLMVAGALEGVDSTRELLRQASVRLDLRRFLGYGLSEQAYFNGPLVERFKHRPLAAVTRVRIPYGSPFFYIFVED